MPRIAKALGALAVKQLTKPGQHPVGTVAGLRLMVKSSGARSWVLRTMVGTRRTDIGLGGYPTVTLAQACDRARAKLDEIRRGIDPVAERRSRRTTVVWTFQKTAETYIDLHRAGWKNAKHAAQWDATLATYAYPVFGAKHVRDVSKADVLACIEPIWGKKHETASRVRGRIETVLAFAMQREYRPSGINPAALAGLALPRSSKVSKVAHHAAMPIDDLPVFMRHLRAADGMGARALEFAILTAARSG